MKCTHSEALGQKRKTRPSSIEAIRKTEGLGVNFGETTSGFNQRLLKPRIIENYEAPRP